MQPYILLVATAALVCAFCAGGFVASNPSGRSSRRAALLLLASSYWAICEVAWNLAADAGTAVVLVRASAPGWVFHGPFSLQLLLEAHGGAWPRLRRLVAPLYAVSAGFLALTWTTPWMVRGAVRTSWGWGYEVGPAHPFMYVATMLGVGAGLVVAARFLRDLSSPAEQRQRPWLVLGILTPVCMASLTDCVLPFFQIQWPRLGTSAMACLGAIALWNVLRFGHSLLTPGTFADQILRTIPDGVALLHPDGRVRSVNAGFEALSGHPAATLAGTSIERLFGDEKSAVEERESRLVCATGERIPVSIASSELCDRQGYPLGRVLVVRDLRDMAQLRGHLVTSARLAAVGELAAGIAHEINNPLAFVRSNLSLLARHWQTLRAELEAAGRAAGQRLLLTEGEELIQESVEGVDRAAEIVRGVKGFSHAGHSVREPTDLNQLLEDVLRMVMAQLKHRATVERCYSELPPVECVPQELKQVFLNLFVNAGQAIGEGGRIRVVTHAHPGFVTVKVEDDGCGIAPENLDRIFDPFFTTKSVGEGTGLGLGIAYRIVRSHGGEIEVDSDPGRGSRFSVRLPVR
jgi:PAS domain S-box-containing protein